MPMPIDLTCSSDSTSQGLLKLSSASPGPRARQNGLSVCLLSEIHGQNHLFKTSELDQDDTIPQIFSTQAPYQMPRFSEIASDYLIKDLVIITLSVYGIGGRGLIECCGKRLSSSISIRGGKEA